MVAEAIIMAAPRKWPQELLDRAVGPVFEDGKHGASRVSPAGSIDREAWHAPWRG